MGCDDVLTVGVEQRGIKPHLEWGQRVIGRLSFDIKHWKKNEEMGVARAHVLLSAQVHRNLEVLG